jgi:hypothetical protein
VAFVRGICGNLELSLSKVSAGMNRRSMVRAFVLFAHTLPRVAAQTKPPPSAELKAQFVFMETREEVRKAFTDKYVFDVDRITAAEEWLAFHAVKAFQLYNHMFLPDEPAAKLEACLSDPKFQIVILKGDLAGIAKILKDNPRADVVALSHVENRVDPKSGEVVGVLILFDRKTFVNPAAVFTAVAHELTLFRIGGFRLGSFLQLERQAFEETPKYLSYLAEAYRQSPTRFPVREVEDDLDLARDWERLCREALEHKTPLQPLHWPIRRAAGAPAAMPFSFQGGTPSIWEKISDEVNELRRRYLSSDAVAYDRIIRQQWVFVFEDRLATLEMMFKRKIATLGAFRGPKVQEGEAPARQLVYVALPGKFLRRSRSIHLLTQFLDEVIQKDLFA